MLGRRRRRWISIKTTSVQRLVIDRALITVRLSEQLVKRARIHIQCKSHLIQLVRYAHP